MQHIVKPQFKFNTGSDRGIVCLSKKPQKFNQYEAVPAKGEGEGGEREREEPLSTGHFCLLVKVKD